jgi:anthranilate synthase component 1
MSVAVGSLPLTPSLGEARALARDYNVIPLRHTFIDDIETPVSAFLKLRGRGPAFLLESAEQGQRFGRWSFLGFRPRAVLRLEAGRLEVRAGQERQELDASDPFRAWPRSRACRPLPGVPWACSATTWCAPSSACRSRTPMTSAPRTWR